MKWLTKNELLTNIYILSARKTYNMPKIIHFLKILIIIRDNRF